MADLAYREVYAMTREQARLRMVMAYAETQSASETARRWGTSRQVVRKWLKRFLRTRRVHGLHPEVIFWVEEAARSVAQGMDTVRVPAPRARAHPTTDSAGTLGHAQDAARHAPSSTVGGVSLAPCRQR